jgi:hypothetical protein
VLHLLLYLLFLLPRPLLGDGRIFPPAAFPEVKIPDQKALIHFADGQETLVIETSFVGQGRDFDRVVRETVPRAGPAA